MVTNTEQWISERDNAKLIYNSVRRGETSVPDRILQSQSPFPATSYILEEPARWSCPTQLNSELSKAAETDELVALFTTDHLDVEDMERAIHLLQGSLKHHLRRYKAAIRKTLEIGTLRAGKLSTTATRLPTEDAPNLMEIRKLLKRNRIKVDDLLSADIIKLGDRRLVRMLMAKDLMPRDCYFRTCTVETPNTFGKMRTFCPPDIRSAWVGDVWSVAFKSLSQSMPFGGYRKFWSRRAECYGFHDWSMFTSSIHHFLIELCFDILLNDTTGVSDDDIYDEYYTLYDMYSPHGHHLSITLHDFLQLSKRLIAHPIHVEFGMIDRGTTLGMGGGWQLSSILHASLLENTRGVGKGSFIVRGDDALVRTKIVDYMYDFECLLGPPISITKSGISETIIVWLKKFYVNIPIESTDENEWVKSPYLLMPSAAVVSSRSRSIEYAASWNDTLLESVDGPPLSHAMRNYVSKVLFDTLVYYMPLLPTTTITPVNGDSDCLFWLGRKHFLKYKSSDPSWMHIELGDVHERCVFEVTVPIIYQSLTQHGTQVISELDFCGVFSSQPVEKHLTGQLVACQLTSRIRYVGCKCKFVRWWISNCKVFTNEAHTLPDMRSAIVPRSRIESSISIESVDDATLARKIPFRLKRRFVTCNRCQFCMELEGQGLSVAV